MKLILVRHGQTLGNVKKIIQGQQHGKLSALGKEQAKKVGLRLKHEQIDAIYTSDLQRAKDTAQEIIKYHPNATVVYSPLLRERHYGEFESKAYGSLSEYVNKNKLCHWHFVPKGGESNYQLHQRILRFFTSLLKKHKQQTVVVVSHGNILTLLLIHLFKKQLHDYREMHPDNTAVTILEFKGKTMQVHVFNCTAHLQR
ncbi:MAG: histidine phosphatase family protein [Candidatus Woesearchaeota archaeon]